MQDDGGFFGKGRHFPFLVRAAVPAKCRVAAGCVVACLPFSTM